MAMAITPSIGIFPKTFPRDPVEVNLYLEHVLLGQVLEPLVTLNAEGQIAPGIAKSWKMTSDSKEILFFVDPDITFSNGAPVTAEDIRFSLERHRLSSFSQSKTYLQNIAEIDVIDQKTLKIALKQPYIAILKVLSRNQLGIVPKDWSFNSEAQEPFCGTGPYRAVKENDGWFLIQNERYRNAKAISVPKWKIFQADTTELNDLESLPDLIPFIDTMSLEELQKNKNFTSQKYTKETASYFVQSVAWWNPAGQNANDETKRKISMAFMDEWVQDIARTHHLSLATSLIPQGIPGYLPQRPHVVLQGQNLKQSFTLKIGVLKRDMPLFANKVLLDELKHKFGVAIEITSFELADLLNGEQSEQDVLFFAFAGAFQDPEGFLAVLEGLLKTDLESLFGPHHKTYQSVSANMNWDSRNAGYQSLMNDLVESGFFVPGWRLKIAKLSKNFIFEKPSELSFTIDFLNFVVRKEVDHD